MTFIPRTINLFSSGMLLRHMQRVEGRFINLWALSYSSQSSLNEGASRPTVPSHSNRVPKTLYRQLLKWCRDYKDIPFDPMPPVTLSPPLVSPLALKRLRGMRALLDRSDAIDSTCEIRDHGHPAHYALYNQDIDVRDNMIVFPEIKDTSELKGVIRSIYWLNHESTIAERERGDVDNVDGEHNAIHQKERISLAFDAIKSCNQLSSTELDNRAKKRQQSIDAREIMSPVINYHVGQIVQHKLNKWRGVVVGWNVEDDNRIEEANQNRLTSLTTKQYPLKSEVCKDERVLGDSLTKEKKDSKVKYTLLLDKNDATIMHTSKYVSLELQDDLIAVEDPFLRRIHSHSNLISKYFDRFDVKGYFVPNKILSYVYPSDRFSGSVEASNEDPIAFSGKSIRKHELDDTCLRVADGVHEIGSKLLPIISIAEQQQKKNDISNKGNESYMSLINALASDIQSILKDGNCPKKLRTISSTTTSSLVKLYNFHLKIGSLLWTHKIHGENKQRIEFSLGEVVKHKIYGYRGVVVAWDPTPFTDVSNWDGLRDVENANEKPFYHIRPDVNDCIRTFGGPRNFRYVCQENLERWESCRNYGEVEFETELDSAQWRWDPDSGKYLPSEEIKFMYAEELGDGEEIMVSCIEGLREVLAGCLLGVRENPDNGLFSMDDLFLLLKTAESLEDATVVQDLMKEIWKETHNKKLRYQLDSGISDLLEGKNERALNTFTSIIQSDPSYGEAWNKKATVHYMNGDMKESLVAAEKALELDPRNFQALAGIGLVEMDTYRWEQAIDAFRKSLELNPWSMVSARLSVCLNRNKDLPKQSEWPWNRE
mmetsp:Transcript_26462/g.56254  ORF Transcript_26462/g.56254 Transcript_26462/m.56254 type:complete len:825 (-) Transcript_26462:503-2977(-)